MRVHRARGGPARGRAPWRGRAGAAGTRTGRPGVPRPAPQARRRPAPQAPSLRPRPATTALFWFLFLLLLLLWSRARPGCIRPRWRMGNTPMPRITPRCRSEIGAQMIPVRSSASLPPLWGKGLARRSCPRRRRFPSHGRGGEAPRLSRRARGG